MIKRRLGRTGLEVSQIGFGGTWIAQLTTDEALNVVKAAFENGITYYDTARWDGDSEAKIGYALKDVRDKCILATKTGSRTKRESLNDLKESLRLLQTDRVDIIQLHGIDDEVMLQKAISEDGALQTCKQARHEGLVDYIGITSHKPRVLQKAIETGEFDTVLVPINVVTRQALEDLLPSAKAHDVGVVAMKPFSAKTSKLVTCFYNPSLSLLSDEPELKALLGNDIDSMASSALRYTLAQEISVVIPGVKSVHEVQVAAEAGNHYAELTSEEQNRFQVQLDGKLYCRDCGMCLPCPVGIDISAVLRFHSFAEIYDLKQWAKKLYNGLDINASKCTCCGICEPKCPYYLPIIKLLKEVDKTFK
jgi:predicted aldo/keto reductase-like oxidoreductase